MDTPNIVAHFVRCGYGMLQADQRFKPVTWLVVADGALPKTEVVHRLGGETTTAKRHSLGGTQTAVETRLSDGGRVVFLEGQEQSESRLGVELAVLEMWALGLSS